MYIQKYSRQEEDQISKLEDLVTYYDHKITFIFSSDFETVLTKHSPNEILSLNFKKTVYLNAIFRFNGAPLLYQKLIQGRHSLTSFRIQSVNTT